jgi:hypothetical protein
MNNFFQKLTFNQREKSKKAFINRVVFLKNLIQPQRHLVVDASPGPACRNELPVITHPQSAK